MFKLIKQIQKQVSSTKINQGHGINIVIVEGQAGRIDM